MVAVEEAVATGRETWVALTAGPSGQLMTRAAMRDAARACVAAGARAVLVNCVPATQTLAFLAAIREGAPDAIVGAYANAGAEEEGIGWGANAERGAARYAELARTWIAAGAAIVGGCCGTGPAHVRAIAFLR